MNSKEILKSTALFSKLNDVQFAELLSQIQEVRIDKGITFINEGEKADALYVIKEGVLQVFTIGHDNEEVVLARLEVGAFFGEQALLTSSGRRNASVRSITESVLLKVDHKLFLQILKVDETLKRELKEHGFKQLFENLKAVELNAILSTYQKVYQSSTRGEVIQYSGHFLHMPAVISKFKLNDDQEVVSSRVIGKNIQSIHVSNALNPQTYIHEGKTIYRELKIAEGQLVGITAYGEWNALKELYSRLFEKKGISEIELKHFIQLGELTFSKPISSVTENDEEIICNCMYVKKGTIITCIREGHTSFEELTRELAVGSVCGSCIPTIQAMLGHESWQAMHILSVSNLTPVVRAYRLIPLRNKRLPQFHAGQHIVIQCLIDDNWVERSYTLTSAPKNSEYYEIAVKLEDRGLLSGWLFKNDDAVPFIRVSKPTGQLTIKNVKSCPMICLTAGIGITPAVCFARAFVEINASRPLYIYATAHTLEYLPYDLELESLAANNAQIKYYKHITESNGRMKSEDIVKIAQQNPGAEFFICGPKEYQTMVFTTLQSFGINKNQIFIEQFTHANQAV